MICIALMKQWFASNSAAGVSLLVALSFGLAGCSPSATRSSQDTAPSDIRGEPINAPKSNAIQIAFAPETPPVTNTVQAAAKDEEKPIPVAPTGAPPAKAELGTAGAPKPVEEEFMAVTFDKLASFAYEIPDEQPGTNRVANPTPPKDQIPSTIRDLDQKAVALKGFMLPLKVESGLVTEMLIMRDQSMCCYGTVPKINEWVSVKMTNKGVKAIMDQPVTIFGKLRVGEMRENGYLVGIYALDGEKIAGPLDL